MKAFGKTLIFFPSLILLSLSVPSSSQSSGVTDTHITIKEESALIVYTVPTEVIKQSLKSYIRDKDSIANIFHLENNGKKCNAEMTQTEHLSSIDFQQYQFQYTCDTKLNALSIRYSFDFLTSKNHKNFVYTTIKNLQSNTIFSNENTDIKFPSGFLPNLFNAKPEQYTSHLSTW